jgi:hypothetical protein
MQKEEVRQQRGQRVIDLLSGSEKIKTLGQIAKRLTNSRLEAKQLEAKLRRHVPDKQGHIAVKSPLPYVLCKSIAEVFGEQPSSVYIERLPGEEESGTEQPTKRTTLNGNKKPRRAPTPRLEPMATATAPDSHPTVTIPNLGIKDQPAEMKLVRSNRGFVLQLRVPVSLNMLRKFLETKL